MFLYGQCQGRPYRKIRCKTAGFLTSVRLRGGCGYKTPFVAAVELERIMNRGRTERHGASHHPGPASPYAEASGSNKTSVIDAPPGFSAKSAPFRGLFASAVRNPCANVRIRRGLATSLATPVNGGKPLPATPGHPRTLAREPRGGSSPLIRIARSVRAALRPLASTARAGISVRYAHSASNRSRSTTTWSCTTNPLKTVVTV
jgi:hypothetical protein